MDLPNLFSSSPKKDKLFLGIVLTEQSAQAILWKIARGDISVIKTSETFTFEKPEDLIVKTDQALQELGELSENLSEIIFGLESSWVNQKGIVDAKKPILKKLTTDLSLKPVGFVVITEAVVQTIAKNEPHFNALLLFYTETKISVSLIEKGVVQKTESVGRSDDGAGDLVEALARFPHAKDKKLPTKIKLIAVNIDKDELYKQQQSLLTFDWVEKGHFPTVPTIENLPEETIISSVIKQGGKAVAKSQGLEISKQGAKITPTNHKEFAFQEVKINDNNKPSEKAQTALPDSPPPDKKSTQFSFGIPISSQKLPAFGGFKKPTAKPQDQAAQAYPQPQSTKSHKPSPALKWVKSHRTFALIGFTSGLIALLFIGFFSLISTSTAILTLDLNPQNINKDVSITLNPKINQSDFENLILKSELTTKTITTDQVNETTGTTLVGEKAEGKIEIWNKTDGEKSFTAGTNFVANNFRFTLNEDVTIASASTEEKTIDGVTGDFTFPGKAEAHLTAVEIGAESNLEKDTKLTIDSFASNSYEATVLESFSGGSSREIRVISEDDQNKILAELKNKLLEMASLEYQSDSDGEKTFISTNVVKVIDSVYSAEVGDEAKTLTLELTAEVEAIVYQKADLKPLAEAVLADLIPEGFEIIEKDPQILSDMSDKTATGSAVTLDANLSTQAIPIIDLEALKKEIASQSISSTTAIIKGKKEIKNFTIELLPKILEKIWKKLPKNPSQIEIKTS